VRKRLAHFRYAPRARYVSAGPPVYPLPGLPISLSDVALAEVVPVSAYCALLD